MKKGARVGLIGLLAGAAGVGGAAALGSYFYDQAMIPVPHDPAKDKDPEHPIYKGRLWFRENRRRRDVWASSVDGLRLHGNVIRCGNPACQRWAICIHGYADTAESVAVQARHYVESGWNVLLPDLRGHGQSQGDYVGFGWEDRLDIVVWVSRILRKYPQAEIILHGVSMGGTTALLTAGGALPANVKAVVSDCAYTSALAILRHQYEISSKGIGPAGPALAALRTTVKRRHHFDLKNADALNAVRRSRIPTLFIHGVNDNFVPAPMMAELYEQAKCPKEFLWVPEAGHCKAVATDPELYWSTVDRFLERALAGEVN